MDDGEGKRFGRLYAVCTAERRSPYVIRDGAYPNFDGSFEPDVKLTLDQDIERCKVVSELHEKVAKCEMVRHEMVGGDYEVQRTVFSDGTVVTVDFRNQVYEITR